MKKLVLVALSIITFTAFGQKKTKTAEKDLNTWVDLTAGSWDAPGANAEFTNHDGRPALKVLPKPGQVILKNTTFSNGTIEFDYIPTDQRFASFYFRYKDSKETELFYFRTHRSGDTTGIEAVQYTPNIDGVNLWDLLPHYQGKANFQNKTWNHVKLIASGYQLRVFVNDMQRPTMEVPRMEGNVMEGTLAFEGEGIVSNLVIKPGQTEGLPAYEGTDPVANDPRYLRKWQVSEPAVLPKNVDFSTDYAPKAETMWGTIWAERRGMINLTRKFGMSKERRIVWMKVDINSKTDQRKKIAMGFSDDIWVFLNGRYLYVDKNTFGAPIMKEPAGRCSIENSSFIIPLKAGKNELMVALANDFYGWAIIARLEDMDGISIE
ncbi:family 16 glycoside hydrolase [Dyadobacter endophyticus]|uniref:family 16 glycoside hydrolase n=1 Tax=Dyadobacter TaxID=120831 RepID=UPI003CF87381